MDDRSTRQARAELEQAGARSEKSLSAGSGRPQRYKLYDRIKDHVSLRTVDLIIIITSALIIVALVVGILTATPTQ